MSILIQGLSMPDEGCHHTICIYSDGKVETGEPNSYQAIPLPPHGRLTDADALYAVMKKERDRIFEDYGSNDEYVQCFNKYAMSMVRSAPTIIEAEKGEA